MALYTHSFDISVSAGSGLIAVIGPSGSGKTHAVMQYLAQRKQNLLQVNDHHASPSLMICHVPMKACECRQSLPELLLPFVASLSGSGKQRFKKTGDAGGSLSLQQAIHSILRQEPNQSEFHLVLDDVDCDGIDPTAISLVFQAISPLPSGRKCMLWCVTRAIIPLTPCVRYHFIAKPKCDAVLSWLNDPRHSHLSSAQGDTVVASAVRHYMSAKPMCASVMASDSRLLLQSVQMLLPTLYAIKAAKKTTTASLNELDFSKAWSELPSASLKQHGDGSSGTDSVLVSSVRGIGVSAQLLCLASFYCGAVTSAKDRSVFGSAETDLGRRGSTTAHNNTVLTSATHTFTRKRLLAVYASMISMACGEGSSSSADLFIEPTFVAHHIRSLLEWGMLSFVQGRNDVYHCHITTSAAMAFSKDLGIKLMELIPMR